MKKLIKIVSLICLTLSITLIMSACSIGTCTIKFEANGGTGYLVDRYYSPNESVTELPLPNKAGFNFEGWYSDEALTTKVCTPFSARTMTLYAKYVINENWYTSSDSNIQYSGGTTKKQINFTDTGIKKILLKQQGGTFKFTSVKIETDYENNSNFDCTDFKLYNVNGFEIKNGYYEENEWQPETPMNSTEGLFLIEFNVTRVGSAYIIINGVYTY